MRKAPSSRQRSASVVTQLQSLYFESCEKMCLYDNPRFSRDVLEYVNDANKKTDYIVGAGMHHLISSSKAINLAPSNVSSTRRKGHSFLAGILRHGTC